MKLKKVLRIVFISIGIFFAIGLIGVAMEDTETTTATTSAPADTDATPSAPVAVTQTSQPAHLLFANPEGFRTAFNSFCTENDFDMNIAEITVTEGSVNNVFSLGLTQNVSLIGAVDKASGGVKEVTMFGARGNANSGIEIFTAIGSIIGAVEPTMTPTEKGSILKSLGLLDKKTNLDDHQAKYEINGNHYWINCNDVTGISFGVRKS